MDLLDIDHRFTYHAPHVAEVAAAHERARKDARDLATVWAGTLPDGREKSLAITKLEEALFWANAAIARHNA